MHIRQKKKENVTGFLNKYLAGYLQAGIHDVVDFFKSKVKKFDIHGYYYLKA